MYKILYVIDNLGVGGAQKQLLELLRGTNRNEFEPVVCSLSDWKNPLKGVIEDLGIKTVVVPQQGTFSVKALKGLTRLIREEKPDLINTYLFTANLYGRLAGFFSRVPVVCSSRGYDSWMKPHYVWANWLLQKLGRHYIGNAERVVAFFRRLGVGQERLSLIYNGVDLGRFFPGAGDSVYRERFRILPDERVIGILGRLSREKDHRTFLEAAKLVSARKKGVRFFIGGDGHLMKELKKLSAQLGIADRVYFLGTLDETTDFFNAIDLFVLSSVDEGCSNVILEAMAMEKPVVATRVGGNPELITEGTTGLLVAPGRPEELACSILEVLKDDEAARRMGRAGRRRVESCFSTRRMIKETEELYRKIVNVTTSRMNANIKNQISK